MPSGTEMNEVFAARIHKANAKQIRGDARHSIEYGIQCLIVLAAATPTPDEKEMLVNEVRNNIDWIVEESWREWAAEYIEENSELCNDELEGEL